MRRMRGRRRVDLRDEDEMRAAYDAHGAELYRFALRQLGDVDAARDVVQEVFLRAWSSAARFDQSVASLRVWLFAIARNAVIDHIRHTRARPVSPASGETIADLADVNDDFADAMVVNWIIEEALRRLTPQHREALVETYLRGRPCEEVAAEFGVPAGTVRSRVFYGLKALRLVMDEIGVELS
nr:sigma-70 family RNA polymerase sigma factor [Kibdelosporangium sp. MJ126-NF4]CEL18700.1 RNA polymerase sigma-54 factor RpoN [Kibdelosporangium sp. MJ126-NF4]CTQ98184.1 RNA polymerase sigma-54 factor RpoN [Kibdelosporangium sp. MJ126-NF4]